MKAKALLVLASILAATFGASAARAADAPPPRVTCSFSHPAYSGFCKETQDVPQGSTPAAVCQDILGCLNSAGCSKTYCNATTLREGWRLEKVETSPAPK